MSSRPKLPEIDVIRAIAIIAVLVIHGTASATLLPIGTGSQAVFFILNKASLFTVPLFIWISGVVLFYSYYDRWKPHMSFLFWTKRLRKIVIPYVVASLFYYVYNQFMYHGKINFDTFYFLKLLLSGHASYHLYYIVIIVQFYVLFPLIMNLVRKYRFLRMGLIPLGIILQAACYAFNHWIHPIPEYTSLCLTYVALFAFGAFTGIYYEAVVAWMNINKLWIWITMMLGGIGYVGMLLLHQYGALTMENTWFELALLVYSMAMAVCCMQGGRRLLASRSRLGEVLVSLGIASFTIYLVHPALLTLWDHILPMKERIWLYDLHTMASILFGLSGSWLIARLYQSTKKDLKP
ncbi:acyltransferase [Paenibacillus sp. N3.4]|uniref:acyltransferase n=1 Tax=Paenibacillus sp. N3.4 TaxID=2603222 RepID=UPI0011CA9DEA|nr:acyltransferase [Paenibacillus sp. N3.4]TXK86105.1 acyltransferase [Paenibacillus sp. N3.4]